MANEFIARKGIISLDSIQVSGSITATGGITVSGSISSASFATSTATASSADNFFVRQNLTASSALFTGSITAQTLVVQTVTSSIVYSSGSNIFGNQLTNVQQMTGSLRVTGSGIFTSCLIAAGGSDNNNNEANTIIVNGTNHSRLKINTSTAGGYQASLVLSSGCAISCTGNDVVISTAGSQEMRFSTAGSEKMRITSAGNVGIGATTPGGRLSVSDNADTPQALPVVMVCRKNNLASPSAANAGLRIFEHSSNTSFYITDEGNVPYFVVRGGGNVGIGTCSPPVGLSVQGSTADSVTLQLKQNAVGGRDFRITSRDDGSLRFNDDTAGSERMRIDSSGNVGIGYTPCTSYGPLQVKSPASSYTVDLVGRTAGLNGESQITFWNSGQTVVQGAIGNIARCMVFYAGGTEVMRMTCGGNVLVGCSTDNGNRLETTGTANNWAFSAWGNTTTGQSYGGIIRGGTNSSDVAFRVNNAANNLTYFTINGSGNIGMGTTSISTEANLFLGAQSAGEGGQLVLQKGTSCSCATHLDNYQNAFRIMSGTDTGSTTVNVLVDHVQRFLAVGRTIPFSVFGDSTGIVEYGDGTIYAAASGTEALGLSRRTNDGAVALFRRDTTTVGSICVTASATSFNTSSDYRLKTDLKSFNGVCLIARIKPYDFKWKVNCDRMYGFIAHELAEVLPYVVSGEKDGEEMQSLDYSKLTPVLVKAIQEQQCQICTQSTIIDQLKTCLGII